MTKSRVQPERPRTALIKDIQSFKLILTERISKGRDLFTFRISSEEQLKQNEKEYNEWDDYNEEFLKSAFNNPVNEYRSSYTNSGFMIGVHEVTRGASIYDPKFRAMTLKQHLESKTNGLESILTKADLIPTEMGTSHLMTTSISNISSVSQTVFIIHGHDEEMKRSVQLFLNKVELKDIVLHEQPDRSRTVIEKLIGEGASAGYVIALLSPDDVQADGTLRARQNVILEIGYFIGKLGRDKVRLLKRGDTVIPSDLQGILYDTYDTAGTWRIKLAKEIQAVGLPINISNVITSF